MEARSPALPLSQYGTCSIRKPEKLVRKTHYLASRLMFKNLELVSCFCSQYSAIASHHDDTPVQHVGAQSEAGLWFVGCVSQRERARQNRLLWFLLLALCSDISFSRTKKVRFWSHSTDLGRNKWSPGSFALLLPGKSVKVN